MSRFSLPRDRLFIIAEIANAHTGSPDKLKMLVGKAIEAKPDAIKFQLFKATELLIQHHKEFDLFENLEINDSYMSKIFSLVKKSSIRIFADVFSVERAEFANKNHADAFKIHSSDINNRELLRYLASIGKPILLSCSGCTVNEIDEAINVVKKGGTSQIVLMHGFQGFPTEINDIHMSRIASLRDRYDLSIGYSDHLDGDSELSLYMPMIALGYGANIIEKHITIDRSLKEEDYQSSLNPDEFAKMVRLLKESYKSIGSTSFEIKGAEERYRKDMKKRCVASRELKANHIISKDDIILKRVDYPTPDVKEEAILGSMTKKSINAGVPITGANARLKVNKVVAAIACRVESTRLFAKPLQRVTNDLTILDFIILQLRKSRLIDEIVLAISENVGNEIFVEYSRKNNLKFVRGNDENVLQRVISAAELVNANVVFRVTSEDPFNYWQAIDPAIKQHLQTCSDFTYTPDLPVGCGFEIINLAALKISQANGKRRNRSELVTSYIHEHQETFETMPFEVEPHLKRPELRLTVDYPEDLILVRTIASMLKIRDIPPELGMIIKLIDSHPELKEINNKFSGSSQRIWP